MHSTRPVASQIMQQLQRFSHALMAAVIQKRSSLHVPLVAPAPDRVRHEACTAISHALMAAKAHWAWSAHPVCNIIRKLRRTRHASRMRTTLTFSHALMAAVAQSELPIRCEHAYGSIDTHVIALSHALLAATMLSPHAGKTTS